ncbi:MAG: radical SAM protein [Thermoleophilia bacterium]
MKTKSNITNKKNSFSIVYQITQACPFKCAICNRRFEEGEKPIRSADRELMINVLKEHGLKRLTVTGGEPMMLGDELFEFLRYVHNKQIHVCLSTTGYLLNKEKILNLNEYLDHLLISIRSFNIHDWIEDFGKSDRSIILLETVKNLLHWVKSTDIVLEVSTVIHKKNVDNIVELGWQILKINPNIIWRIEDYYPMGKEYNLRHIYEFDNDESIHVRKVIAKNFKGKFRNIYFSNCNRSSAPDIFITPSGNMITTSNNRYSKSICNVIKAEKMPEFNMRRHWTDYEVYCREW